MGPTGLSQGDGSASSDIMRRESPSLSTQIFFSTGEANPHEGRGHSRPAATTRVEKIIDYLASEHCGSRNNGNLHEDNSLHADPLAVYLRGHLEEISKKGCEGQSRNTLMMIGNILDSRFRISGALEDINKLIDCWSSAISLTSDFDTDRPGILSDLGRVYLTRFERVGKLPDLEKSIECGLEATSLTPDGHPHKPGVLSNLGRSLLGRFNRLEDLPDLDKAIECWLNALTLTPDGHPDKPGELANLGNSYRARFIHKGELSDLSRAVEYGSRAVSLIPNDHPQRIASLINLGISYQTRFEHIGEMSDLCGSTSCLSEALSLTPDDHLHKPIAFGSLGISYQARYEHTGELSDLSKAVEYKSNAVSLTVNDHSDKPGRLRSLGRSYLSRFNRLGELSDLDRAIECQSVSASLIPDGHPDKPRVLDDLGVSYQSRFERLGQLSDLNKAIEYGSEAVSHTPHSCFDKPAWLTNLGISYSIRFDRLGELPDLNRAIDCELEAVALSANGHPNRLASLSSLGNSYQARFDRLGKLPDLDCAIEYRSEAVLLIPEGHPHKPRVLGNLGSSYRSRFELLDELPDLNEAIKYNVGANSLTPDGHPDKAGMLANLGVSFRRLFERLHDLSDLNRAIECGSEAALLTPDGHPTKPGRLNNLGKAYITRFNHSQSHSDIESALTCFKDAAQLPSGPPLTRFHAFRAWAELGSRHGGSSPYPIYQQAMELLPQLVWIGTTIDRRYGLIKEVGSFSTEAAACAIANNSYDLAIEWLEAGRSIVWSQIAQLRTPFDQLFTEYPDLANNMKELGRKLEYAGARSSFEFPSEGNAVDLGKEANNHIQLALKWDSLLSEVRSKPEFQNFLRPPKADLLLSSAGPHPIVVINIYKSRCDALVLRPDSKIISHVPLTSFSIANALAAREQLVRLPGYRGFARANKSVAASSEEWLRDMWSGLVQPVLDFLDYTHKLPFDQLPHITWCTTGLLSFLPLHAAGCYDQSQLNAFDFVISSYTPTLSALLPGQRVAPDTHYGVLVVGQEHTPGFNSLPCVRDELSAIENHAKNGVYLRLENDEATVDQVLDAMSQFSWIHMACHGTQNPADPRQSAFHLHDGHITLVTLSKQSFENKGLAFLSACQTAAGDEQLPDEAVHLAAGMLMAGYPSVIGTMWSIADEDGPQIAGDVYAELINDDGMDCTKAAEALHRAVGRLRAQVGEKSVGRWAPFIHIGS